jgi:thioredoxin-related protein
MFEKWNVDAIPTMILIDKDNKEIRRNTGFINAKEFGTFFYGK